MQRRLGADVKLGLFATVVQRTVSGGRVQASTGRRRPAFSRGSTDCE